MKQTKIGYHDRGNIGKVIIDDKIIVKDHSKEYYKALGMEDPRNVKKHTWRTMSMTLGEMARIKSPKHVWLTKDGPNRHTLNIYHNPQFKKPSEQSLKEGGNYFIELEDRCSLDGKTLAPELLLDWIYHIMKKPWFTPKMGCEVIEACNSHFNTFCGLHSTKET